MAEPDDVGTDMAVTVDLNLCEGYGQCAFAAPSVFRMHGAEALHYDPRPDAALRPQLERAATACPVQAIRLGAAPATAGAGTVPDRPAVAGPVVIVGASLAGLRVAEALRGGGYGGPVVVIGDEPHLPYQRPALSKAVLADGLDTGHLELPLATDLDVEWRLGHAAVALDTDAQRVLLDDGSSVGYDRLLIATGTRARTLGPATPAEGVYAVRTREDAEQLRDRLARGVRRVVVIGAGLIGGEIASSCVDLGLRVTVVERAAVPMQAALGVPVGESLARLARLHGVDLRLAVAATVDTERVGDVDRVRAVTLSDGTVIAAEVVIVALGATPNTEWLAGSPLDADRQGASCDAWGRALDTESRPVPGVFVAGDVARTSPMPGVAARTVEHWSNAEDQARIAARSMLATDIITPPDRDLPRFWSSQYGVNIKGVGVPAAGDEVAIVQGTLESNRFSAVYGRDGRIVGAVTVDNGKALDFYERLVADGAPFPPRFAVGDRSRQQTLPAGFPLPIAS